MGKKLIALSFVLAVCGCATAPQSHQVTKSKVYNETYDQVWSNLMDLLASKGVQIKTVEKDSGIVYFESSGFRDDQADCGKSGLYTVAQKQANVNVYVRKVSSSQTRATVNSEFKEARRFGNNPAIIVDCTSRGKIENAILSKL